MQNGRKLAAAALALASVVPLGMVRFAPESWGGGGRSSGAEYDYETGRLDTRAVVVSIALALVIAGAAAAVWLARDRRVLAAALLAAVTAGWLGSAAAAAERDRGKVSRADDRAVRAGMSRAAVEDVLGRPGGTGTATRDGSVYACTVYRVPGDMAQLYCYDGDRLAFKVDR